MRLLECLLVKNDCYKRYHNDYILPTRIVVHSTDKAGMVIKRFVQPAEGQTYGLKDGDKTVTAKQMMSILGKNYNGNDWNRPYVEAAVHAFLGKLEDGSYAVCKTLEYTQPCWGVAFGTRGSFDGRQIVNGKTVVGGELAIQFEMIEDGNSPSKAHCKALYDLAVEFCAYLIRLFPSITVDGIVSHKEAHDLGYGSNHGDPESYWKRCGMDYTMYKFRADVREELKKKPESEAINMTEEQLEQFVNGIIDQRFPGLWDQAYQRKMESYQDNDSGKWSEAARKWAVENGIVAGVGNGKDGNPNYAWEAPLTREQYVQTEYRQHLKEIKSEGGGGDV